MAAAWRLRRLGVASEVKRSVTVARAAGAVRGAARGAARGEWRAGGSGSSARRELSALETKPAGQQRQMWSSIITETTRRRGPRRSPTVQGELGRDSCPRTCAAYDWIPSWTPRPRATSTACQTPYSQPARTGLRSGREPRRPGGSPIRAHDTPNGLGAR